MPEFYVEDEGYTPVICPKCNVPMRRRKSSYGEGYWHGCVNYPDCKVTAAEHPDGTVMSTPADEDVKRMRRQCHAIANRIWPWDDKDARKKMYIWMKKNTVSGHIGLMEESELTALAETLMEMDQKQLDFGFNIPMEADEADGFEF